MALLRHRESGYHHRTIALDNVRLVKLAMVALDQTAVKDSWQHYLGDFLHGRLGQQQLFHNFDIASVIKRAKHQHAFEYFADVQHSSLMLYRTMQPECKSAEYQYLSVVKCASNIRLISRFRTECHGLRVDTGRWADGVHLDRTDRLCLVCKSLDYVEDEQHFVFDCPAYSHIRSQHLDLLQHCCTIADFMTLCEPNACGGFLREFLHSHFDQIPATLTGITHDVTAGTAGGGDTEQSRRPRLL